MTKTCPYCQHEFNVPGGSYRRTPCYRPECVEEHEALQYQKSLASTKRTRKKEKRRTYKRRDTVESKAWPYKCQYDDAGRICGKPLKSPFRYHCQQHRRIIEDYGIINSPGEVYGELSY